MRSTKVRFVLPHDQQQQPAPQNLQQQQPTLQHLQQQQQILQHYQYQLPQQQHDFRQQAIQQQNNGYLKHPQQKQLYIYEQPQQHQQQHHHQQQQHQQQHQPQHHQQHQQQQQQQNQHSTATGPSPLTPLSLPPCPLPRYRKHQLTSSRQRQASHKYGVFEHVPLETTTITNSYKRNPQHRQFNYQLVNTQLSPQKVQLQHLKPLQQHLQQQQLQQYPQQQATQSLERSQRQSLKPPQPQRPPSWLTVPRTRHMVPRKQYMPSKEVINEVISRLTIPPPPRTLAPSVTPYATPVYARAGLQSPEDLLQQLKEKLEALDRIVNEGVVGGRRKGLEDIQESDETVESPSALIPTPEFNIPDVATKNDDDDDDDATKNDDDDDDDDDDGTGGSADLTKLTGEASKTAGRNKPPLPAGKKPVHDTPRTHQLLNTPPPFGRSRQMSLPKSFKSPGQLINLSQRKIIKALSALQLNKPAQGGGQSYTSTLDGRVGEEEGKKRRLSSSSSLAFFSLKNRWDSWRWSFTNFKHKSPDGAVKPAKKLRKRRSLTSVFSSWSSSLASCTRAPKEEDDDDEVGGGDDDDDGYLDVSGSDDGGRSASVISEGTLKHDDGDDTDIGGHDDDDKSGADDDKSGADEHDVTSKVKEMKTFSAEDDDDGGDDDDDDDDGDDDGDGDDDDDNVNSTQTGIVGRESNVVI